MSDEIWSSCIFFWLQVILTIDCSYLPICVVFSSNEWIIDVLYRVGRLLFRCVEEKKETGRMQKKRVRFLCVFYLFSKLAFTTNRTLLINKLKNKQTNFFLQSIDLILDFILLFFFFFILKNSIRIKWQVVRQRRINVKKRNTFKWYVN